MEKETLTTGEYQEICDNVYRFSSIAFSLLLARDVGILDALLEAKIPMTSEEISSCKGLKERYTREILACLVTAKLVKASKNGSQVHIYYLEEGAKTVLRNNINQANILLPFVIKSLYDDVQQCVPLSGPMGIRTYTKDLFKLIDVFDKPDQLNFILEKTPELESRLEKGINVLELGSGMGSFIENLANKYPKSTFTASERKAEQVEVLKSRLGYLPNVSVIVVDLGKTTQFPKGKFDWITMKNVSHIVPQPVETKKAVRRIVAEPDGIFTSIDFFGKGDPMKSVGDLVEAATYTFSIFCCIPSTLHQDENSKPFGCCWDRETGIQIAEEANFNVKSFAVNEKQILFVAKPK